MKTLTLSAVNTLPSAEVEALFHRCCGCRRWARELTASRPFASRQALMERGDALWSSFGPVEWMEAFSHHPLIGEKQLREKFQWEKEEQAGTKGASEETLRSLAEGNQTYRLRFGFIFLICATGKSAEEMLAQLKERLTHSPEVEMEIAAEEQRKITHIRLEKLIP